jgi:hypothetical protein
MAPPKVPSTTTFQYDVKGELPALRSWRDEDDAERPQKADVARDSREGMRGGGTHR